MQYVVTNAHRKKIVEASHNGTALPRVAQIALGTGGVSGTEVRVPSANQTTLNAEKIRRPYTGSERVNDFCYEYRLTLGPTDLVGQQISEMALIDSAGGLIAIVNFLPKTKDDIEETYRIRNYYE